VGLALPGARYEGRSRRRLPEDWSPRIFITWANENGLRYVLLRWFENLPDLHPDEDLDILVADESVERLMSVVRERQKRGVPCDIYSVTGVMRTKYKGIPYYPPHLAAEILDNTELHQGYIPVPSKKYHFLSLAYHSVFHKGPASDLSRDREEPRESTTSSSTNSHFYALRALRDELGLDVAIDFNSLAEYLGEQNWEPSPDLLRKLGETNEWARRLYAERADARESVDGIGVIVLRDWAVRNGWLPRVLVHIQRIGMTILTVQELTGPTREIAFRFMRGGNWAASPLFPTDGGGPAMMISVFDPDPAPVATEDQERYPHTSNGRLLALKRDLREMMNEGRKQKELVNTVHTSDDATEATYYLEVTNHGVIPTLRELVEVLTPRADGAASPVAEDTNSVSGEDAAPTDDSGAQHRLQDSNSQSETVTVSRYMTKRATFATAAFSRLPRPAMTALRRLPRPVKRFLRRIAATGP
jgi:hypothetical protein